MPNFARKTTFLLAALIAVSGWLNAQDLQSKTAGMASYDGYFRFYWEEATGKIWLEVDRWDEEFLYVTGMASGLGSNDIGLDRTQLHESRIVHFRRVGPKALLVQPNLRYRAGSDSSPAERKSVADGFAESVLWGFPIEIMEGDRGLIDLTPFLINDAVGLSTRLERMNEGSFKLDEGRSVLYLPRTRAFPENCEFETSLTFQGDEPGSEVRSVTPSPELITVRQHHSFIKLPDEGYRPREAHVMSGYFPLTYQDYTVPIGEDLTQRFIRRHRLEKADPRAETSAPLEPIIYYLDPGTPEPIRSALIEGGSWWNQAFEAIGYRDAFRIEMLPPDADPMDVRYNVINWLHRSTRGWSYGASIVDPRTGEILKGHVNLGSLRVRQDYLIAEGLLSPYSEGLPEEDPMLKMALARIRQLSAHEIGHTLGLSHNFASSTNDRASVMDYPHPRIRLNQEGEIDLSQAYATGIGRWDKVAIAYGYQDFPPGVDEKEGLRAILERGYREEGLRFISDADARPPGGLHPLAHLWDNNDDPVEQLLRLSEVRKVALSNFGAASIRSGRPMATLEEPLVPIYLLHRYQTEAVSKLVGGVEYQYSVKGSWQESLTRVPAGRQIEALDALLGTLKPEFLELPADLLDLLPPRPPGYPAHRELSGRYSGLSFDPLALAEASVNHTVSMLLNPQRAARLVQQEARSQEELGLKDLIERLLDHSWNASGEPGFRSELRRTVGYVVLQHLLALATDAQTAPQVRAIAHLTLLHLKEQLLESPSSGNSQQAANAYAIFLIDNYLKQPEKTFSMDLVEVPPGAPIGCGQ